MTNERLKRRQREIVERIIIKGTLVLTTPTCFSSGDAEGPTDLMLLRDSISSHALLTGASIAGALRNYVREYENGYGKSERNNSLATRLFGGTRSDEDGDQSPLIINDSISSDTPQVELRDGVRINSATGIAEDGAKYDLELLAAGTKFPLVFELLIEKSAERNSLLQGLKIALEGLEKGEIRMGTKKRRGFGCCKVDGWKVWQFDLTNDRDRRDWLICDREEENNEIKKPQTGTVSPIESQGKPKKKAKGKSKKKSKNKPYIKIFENVQAPQDKRCYFTMEATFKLASSLLIGSGYLDETAPDAVHLKSKRDGTDRSILSGTSLAGVLRHRAERIVNTLGNNKAIVDDIFGRENSDENSNASRLIVEESVINKVEELVQNRIAIDRFTGGAYHGALFQDRPVFAKEKTEVTLKLELRKPKFYEIGLLLLLLKDLWTSDLPVGSGSSIGRGRLKGVKKATMNYYCYKGTIKFSISQNGDKLEVSDAEKLENCVKKLVKKVRK